MIVEFKWLVRPDLQVGVALVRANALLTTPASNQASDQANRHGDGTSNRNTKGNAADPAYSAELKKCDSVQDEGKQKCIAAAKKKAGQM